MTDKEIVVGGINVSGCKCLRNVKIILELARPEDFELLCGATNGAMKCEQWKDCYYKQLQRKIKECEEKSWEIGNLGYKIKNQRREINERLKQIEKLKRKEQECDELRKENKKLIWKCLERKCKIINLINENSTKEVIYRINGKCVKTTANRVKEITAIVNNQLKKYEQQDRYKQAIDEISELANENKNTPQYRGICQSILEIINNAKDINVLTKKECNNE